VAIVSLSVSHYRILLRVILSDSTHGDPHALFHLFYQVEIRQHQIPKKSFTWFRGG
jgi:hypothetical protein